MLHSFLILMFCHFLQIQSLAVTEQHKLDSFIQIDEEQAMLIVQQQYAQLQSTSEWGKKKPVEEPPEEPQEVVIDINTLADQVAENTFITQKYSAIVLRDQLSKLEANLEEVEAKIAEIQDRLAPVDDEDTCSSISTCEKCVKKQLCGWCVQENRCVRGDNIGPMNTICNFYNYQYCSGPSCIKFYDCDSCLSDPLCGWCDDQVHMMVTCLEQPPDFTGCPSVGWFHRESNQDSCPKKPLPPTIDIFADDQQADQKSQKKKQKGGKGDEPIDRWRPKTWEQNYLDEKAQILQQRQFQLQGRTKSEKQLSLDKDRQDLDLLEQTKLSLISQIKSIQLQLTPGEGQEEGGGEE